MFSKKDIFNQALKDETIYYHRNGGVSIINIGVKISKYPSKLEILNCSKNGDYYQELNNYEYKNHTVNGYSFLYSMEDRICINPYLNVLP